MLKQVNSGSRFNLFALRKPKHFDQFSTLGIALTPNKRVKVRERKWTQIHLAFGSSQSCSIKLSAVIEMDCLYAIQYSSYMWLLSTWNVTRTEFFILFSNYLNWNSHLWPVATTLGRLALMATRTLTFSQLSSLMCWPLSCNPGQTQTQKGGQGWTRNGKHR